MEKVTFSILFLMQQSLSRRLRLVLFLSALFGNTYPLSLEILWIFTCCSLFHVAVIEVDHTKRIHRFLKNLKKLNDVIELRF